MKLELLPDSLSVCRLSQDSLIPSWAMGKFLSITQTNEELSVVCDSNVVPLDVKAEKNWRALKVQGPLDFGLTGILASLATPLAEAGISIFAISTFDTDYILVKEASLSHAIQILTLAGHEFP